MSSVPALLESDVRIATVRAPAEESHDSSKTKFQDAVDARRAEHTRSPSKNEDAGSEDTGEERVNAREHGSEDSEARRSESAEEAREEPSEEPTSERGERRSDARGPRDPGVESAPGERGPARRGTLRGAKDAARVDASAPSRDAVQAALDVAGFGLAQAALEARFPTALPDAPSSNSTAVVAGSGPGEQPAGSVVEAAATVPPADESRVAQRSAVSPSPTAASGLEAGASGAGRATGASAPGVDALATLHAARAAGSAALPVDARGALGASGAASAGESVAARDPSAARSTLAELPSFLQRLVLRVDAFERSAVVELEPVELGRVSISLSLERGGHVRAEVHAQRPEGYAALEARLPELRASLLERGFPSANVNLSLGMADSRSQRSGAEGERGSSSLRRGRRLAEAEIQALLPASPNRHGAIDLWA